MPLTTPTNKETKKEFISRCMSDEIMNDEFPEQKQRLAVCYKQWEKTNEVNRMDITEKIEKYLNEAKKIKIPDEESLGIKGLDQTEIAKAETIGAMSYLMDEFTNKKIAPFSGDKFKLFLKNGVLNVKWTPKGKRMLKVRSEENPTYYNDVIKVFKTAYKKYVKNK